MTRWHVLSYIKLFFVGVLSVAMVKSCRWKTYPCLLGAGLACSGKKKQKTEIILWTQHEEQWNNATVTQLQYFSFHLNIPCLNGQSLNYVELIISPKGMFVCSLELLTWTSTLERSHSYPEWSHSKTCTKLLTRFKLSKNLTNRASFPVCLLCRIQCFTHCHMIEVTPTEVVHRKTESILLPVSRTIDKWLVHSGDKS